MARTHTIPARVHTAVNNLISEGNTVLDTFSTDGRWFIDVEDDNERMTRFVVLSSGKLLQWWN